ncbi:MAG TPA: hypothetical protein PL078_06310 [Bacillota bacterium]|nr:hypothetical protein [Peptococcaceae bacterium MAG4]NLW38167.1 hypothetical protein [Peptococcaceae bacterium]HPZ43603.1 hypothetical protein [Bacillota bacterium]HUM58816.1 hypothetical protein [Bacillota bacterium]
MIIAAKPDKSPPCDNQGKFDAALTVISQHWHYKVYHKEYIIKEMGPNYVLLPMLSPPEELLGERKVTHNNSFPFPSGTVF